MSLPGFSTFLRSCNLKMEQMAGFAPATSCLASRRSDWLNYICVERPVCCAEQRLRFRNRELTGTAPHLTTTDLDVRRCRVKLVAGRKPCLQSRTSDRRSWICRSSRMARCWRSGPVSDVSATRWNDERTKNKYTLGGLPLFSDRKGGGFDRPQVFSVDVWAVFSGSRLAVKMSALATYKIWKQKTLLTVSGGQG